MMPMSADTHLGPSQTSRWPLLFWWSVYAVAGGYGLWQATWPGTHHVSALCLMMAVLVMTLPMIVVHELGHFMAGWLMGLRMIEFSLGTGPVLWHRTWRGLKLVVRQIPFCGHVMHLEANQTMRFKRIVFVSAGPAANVLLAVFLIIGWDVHLTEFFKHPSLIAICAVANLWLALTSLNPLTSRGGSLAGNGSDGWQLWRLLRGKSVRLDAAELIFQKRRNTGLPHLQSLAQRTRDYVLTLLASIAFLSGLVFGLTIITGARTAVFPYVAMLLAFVILLAWWVWRRPWTSFVSRSERAAANPYTDQARAYQHAMGSQVKHWGVLNLPEHTRLESIRLAGDPTSLLWLDTVMAEWPQVRHLQLLKFDALLAGRLYADAEKVMQAVLGWDDLPPEVRTHFESCCLAAHLCSAPGEQGVAACNAAINELTDRGLLMQRLLAFASIIADSGRTELLQTAREWCERAHQIYPFDPTVHQLMGIILVEQRNTTDARAWLHSGTNIEGIESTATTAWLAISTAMEGHPYVARLLKKSLKQELSFPLKRRVEEALAMIPR
ncbi:MAG: site-2 protease family protein [Prosthecobacter sp.]|uniref:site-2 protease family protein n=1 Tax=Prosthecobacter sp. TaxID=1965333 RepID=UPI0038FFCAEC